MHSITDRIDAALEKVRLRRMEVRAIYLDGPDFQALVAAADNRPARPIDRWKGHEVRVGKQSKIYSTHGVSVAVPTRLSARVA